MSERRTTSDILEVDGDRLPDTPALIGLAAALALFYWGDGLPLAPLPQLLALALLLELALLRPDLGLLLVPLTAPLYLIPASVPGLRAEPVRLPLHEVTLLAVAAGVAGRWAWGRLRARRSKTKDQGPRTEDQAPRAERQESGTTDTERRWSLVLTRSSLVRYAPHALLLLAGIFGVLIAVPEGRGAALRELRWLIVEPLVFYALALLLIRREREEAGAYGSGARAATNLRWRLTLSLIIGGVGVAALGLLQFAGLDLVPLLGEKQSFSENVVAAGETRRVASVYGHPNNLGLLLGRVWPLAAALLILTSKGRGPRTSDKGRLAFALGAAALICLAGIGVSFSRGAWLGAVAAAGVLALGWAAGRGQPAEGERPRANGPGPWSSVITRRPLVIGLAALVGLAVVAGLALTLRGGLGGGSVDARVLLWREAAELIRQHPLGLGLDQFYYYHNPEFGRSIIDPSLLGTSEQYASHPHNLVLDAWLNLGPLGLAVLAWLTVRCYRAGLGGLRRARDPIALGVLAAVTAALVHGTVDVFYFAEDLAIIFWLLLALAETAEGEEAGGAERPAR
ncbi:MAG: hypothetical protein RLZZ387_2171 [Chloroflexota bacterium]